MASMAAPESMTMHDAPAELSLGLGKSRATALNSPVRMPMESNIPTTTPKTWRAAASHGKASAGHLDAVYSASLVANVGSMF